MFREKQFGGEGKMPTRPGLLVSVSTRFQGDCSHLLSRTPLVVVVPRPCL